MTGVNQLTQPNEVIGQLMADLQAGTPAAQTLLELMKLPPDYNLNSLFTGLVADTDVQHAFARLREMHPASDYAKRCWQRWHVNLDALDNGASSLGIGSPTIVNDGRMSTNTTLQFNYLNDIELNATAIAALATNGLSMTVSQSGVYRISGSFCLAFYPSNALVGDFSDRVVEVTDSSFLKTPLNVMLKVTASAGVAPRSYHTLFDTFMSQADLQANRKRFVGGSTELRLIAGDKLSVGFQRGSQLGRYRRVVGGVTAYAKEVIGLSKFASTDIGANSVRDTQNWLELIRLS